MNWDAPTQAYKHVEDGLKVVDNLMGFAKAGQGKPNAKERALFAASVVFCYGIWENYVEQLGLELVSAVAKDVAPHKVPPKIKKELSGRSAWEISVSPGWRDLWVEVVKKTAVGNDQDRFGINTMRAGAATHVLELAGIENALGGIPDEISPDHLPQAKQTVEGAVDALVTLRGLIVHTGKVPDALVKGHVTAWRDFVHAVTTCLDKECRIKCTALLAP
jgi:hypothetical protein